MRDHRPTLGDDIIADSQRSKQQQHAKEIMVINQELKMILAQRTERYCRVANIRDSQLILEVASTSIKMKTDYERLNILNQLRSKGFARLESLAKLANREKRRVRHLDS
ncbi:DUF721 domain-containing protein [Vibrio aquaticus]|uniref:DUF721 domain-containing protein n=1 Tax=Vibrio aquaticus TaxID=2496559 RepID=A0A3S0Q1T6_9VIBR|nr:DciA family protein [Vibrio aquaticus]RTZ16039.1 DUF721 domain-containing protein [Vibrio aquaticus]